MATFNYSLLPAHNAKVMTLAQASDWASKRIGRKVTPSNIAYLVNYGRIPKVDIGGSPMVRVFDLERYYRALSGVEKTLTNANSAMT